MTVKHASTQAEVCCYFFIITSSLNSLLHTRALCGCMDNPLVLKTRSTDGAEVLHCVQKKNTHSHFLSYLHELFVDLNKNCTEYTQGLMASDNVKIRYSLRSMT